MTLVDIVLPPWAKYAALAALVLAAAGFGYVKGSARAERHLEAVRAQEMQATLTELQRVAAVDDRVIYQYIPRVTVVHERGKTVTREVTRYVTREADAACPIPAGFVRLHNYAANGTPLPTAPGDSDDAASGIALSTVALTVGENYTTCNAIREQLIALQRAWRERAE